MNQTDHDGVTVAMRLHQGADPIAGWLRIGDGAERPFRGWLQLTALLQSAARAGQDEREGDGRRAIAESRSGALPGAPGLNETHQQHQGET